MFASFPFDFVPVRPGLAAALPAQLQICLSVHGGPAFGFDNFLLPSQLRAVIGGNSVSVPLFMGQTAAAASAAHEAAFVGAGYATVRAAPNLFYVTARPGGLPIVAGAAYGTTDRCWDWTAASCQFLGCPYLPPVRRRTASSCRCRS